MAKKQQSWAELPEPFNQDFRYFLVLVWRQLQLPDPTPVQLDIAHYMQHGSNRRIVEAFRGVGKSWMAAAYVLWLLRNVPQKKFMVVSASKTRADDFSQFCLRLIREMPLLAVLGAGRDEQRSAGNRFDVRPAIPDQSPSLKSVGIFGQLTGSRADTLVCDDAEVPNTSWTVGMREKLLASVGEFNAILKPGATLFSWARRRQRSRSTTSCGYGAMSAGFGQPGIQQTQSGMATAWPHSSTTTLSTVPASRQTRDASPK